LAERHWFIAFEPFQVEYWWTNLFDPEFGHVWGALEWGDQFIVVNSVGGMTDVHITDMPDFSMCTRVLVLNAEPDQDRVRELVPACWNCTEQTKALLGIRAWTMVTPKQLHDYLVSGQDKHLTVTERMDYVD
jgi:hypothetical protein